MKVITNYDKLESGDWFILNNAIFLKINHLNAYDFTRQEVAEINPIRPWVLGITTKLDITGLLEEREDD